MLYDTPYPSANPNGRGLSSPQAEPSLAAMAQLEDLAVPQLQETLAENLGLYVEIDFLTGAGNLATRDGILYAVGADYVTLYHHRKICSHLNVLPFFTYSMVAISTPGGFVICGSLVAPHIPAFTITTGK